MATVMASLFPATCTSKQRLDGKTVVLTGCNTGIGKYTAYDFCKRGAKVIMACRSVEKAENAKIDILNKLKDESNFGSLKVKELDLNSLESVRKCANEIIAEEPKIDLLVNNAGIMMCPFDKTEDGVEKQFGTNHLGHFLFTLILLPRIIESAPSKIINLSSIAHRWGDTNFEDYDYQKVKYNPRRAYGRSKLANVLFTKELARLLDGKGVNAYAVHPGVVRTELDRYLDAAYFRGVTKLIHVFAGWFLLTPEQGAQTTIYCAVDEAAASQTGLYYANCKPIQPTRDAQDMNLAKKLWDVSLSLVKMKDFTLPDKADNPKK